MTTSSSEFNSLIRMLTFMSLPNANIFHKGSKLIMGLRKRNNNVIDLAWVLVQEMCSWQF